MVTDNRTELSKSDSAASIVSATDVDSKKLHTKKIIVFLTVKGGAGRTSCLSNVAWLLARQGKRVLVVDGDVEAPGLSVLNSFQPIDNEDISVNAKLDAESLVAFERGKGLLAVAEFAEKDDEVPLGRFIHPVIVANPDPDARTNILVNSYFKRKLKGIDKLQEFGDKTYTVDEDFWHPDGQLWVLPVGESQSNTSVFNSYRNSGVKGEVIRYLYDFLTDLVASTGKNREGAPIFDYVLVDTRAGFDKWTIDILLPTAGQIAMVAHLNQQGRRESNRLLYNIRTLGFYKKRDDTESDVGEDKFNHLSPLELIPKANRQPVMSGGKQHEIWTIPIHFYSQILPPGENILRNEVFSEYMSLMKEGYDKSLGQEQSRAILNAIPNFFTERSDITQIFYNSSLPLDEDIVSIDADPQNYTSVPYWKFTDLLLRVYEEDIRSKTRLLMDCYDFCVMHNDKFFCDIPLSKDGNVDTETFLNIQQYVSTIKNLSYQEPQAAQNHVELILSQSGLMLRLLASKHPAVEVICNTFFRVAATLPSEYTRSSLLQSIALLISEAGESELDWIKNSEIASKKRLGGENDLLDTIAGIEAAADRVHVATRHLNYDTDPQFKEVVHDNLENGIHYTYYLDTTNILSTVSWEKYYEELKELSLRKTMDFEPERKSQFHRDGLPRAVTVKELIAREEYDLVFYETSEAGEVSPLRCVLFPAVPPDEDDLGLDLFVSTDHPAILSSVQALLRRCLAI